MRLNPRYQSGSSDRYRFTSRENVNGNSLYYLRARYYDTTTGRFLQTDPAGTCGGANFYAYTSNNPANRIDPSGRLERRLIDGGGADGGPTPWTIYEYNPTVRTCRLGL